MELQPGDFFTLKGKGVEYVGISKNPSQESEVQAVVNVNPDKKDEAIHRIISLQEIEEHGENFWNFGETFRYSEFVRQYGERVKSLRDTAILQQLSSGEEGIVGSDGQEFPLPSVENIRNHLLEKSSEYKMKVEQGFTRLHITPFATPLPTLMDKLGEAVTRHQKQGKLFFPKKHPTDPNRPYQGPVIEDHFTLFFNPLEDNVGYFPTSFENNYQSLTKEQVIHNPKYCHVPGWSISLIQENRFIPFKGTGKILGGRPQLETGYTLYEYSHIFSEDVYALETGLTIEDFFTDCISRLEETGEMSHLLGSDNGLIVFGSCGKRDSGIVIPKGSWSYRGGIIISYEMLIEGHSTIPTEFEGILTAVRLGR